MTDRKAYDHAYYLRNRQKAIDKAAAWKKAHADRVRKGGRDYYQRHKTRWANYRAANIERIREQERHRYEQHRRERIAAAVAWKKAHRTRALEIQRVVGRRQRETVCISYVRRVLTGGTNVPMRAWPLALVLAKQAELKLKREINEQTKGHHGTA